MLQWLWMRPSWTTWSRASSTLQCARQAYALEVGFANVRSEADWQKKQGGAQNWASKVDFEMISRIDPRAGDPKVELLRGVEAEIRGELHRDALLAKARSEHKGPRVDPINT